MSNPVLDFLNTGNILIVESQPSVRATLRAALLGLGCEIQKIYLANSFKDAQRYIEESKPKIIISDYECEEHFGLELSLMQKEYLDDPRQRLVGLISTLAESSAIADAADEEVDFFLLKPFTEISVKDYITKAVRRKISPSDFVDMIYSARREMLSNLTAAKQKFQLACILEPSSPTPLYYLGQISELGNELVEALDYYDSGLNLNAYHYRCLSQKFLVQYKLKRRVDAYETLNRLVARFPLTPEMLKNAFTIVVASFDFNEVERYYQMYLRLPRKPLDLKMTVSETLLTSGRILLADGKNGAALRYFQKAAIIAGRPDEMLLEIIETLIKAKKGRECRVFFDMFQPNEVAEGVLKRAKFRLLLFEKPTLDAIVQAGKALIFDGAADEFVCQKTLEVAHQMGNKILVDSIASKAIQLFPDKRPDYSKYFS